MPVLQVFHIRCIYEPEYRGRLYYMSSLTHPQHVKLPPTYLYTLQT
jgi:hypothetical protein